MTQPFAEGQLVRRISRPDEIGPVLSCRRSSQTNSWRVQVLVNGRAREVPASDLIQFDPNKTPTMWDDLADQRFASAAAFHRTLTVERLAKRATELQSAFGSARVKFYPYQFKPVLKFLDNPSHRLLIADDVGLGKTIEAGYILREWQARYPVERVLIVVPARLKTKWQSELRRRFEEHFDVVRKGDVLRHLGGARRQLDVEPFKWIASYETLRDQDIIDLMREITPSLDLAILDEAHRVRNTETAQHQVARIIATCADSMVFLTATPTQTSLDDLWVLLDLLEPGAFGDKRDFAERIEANRPVIRAAQLATAGQTAAAARELEKLRQNDYTRRLSQRQAFQELVRQLRRTPNPSRAQRVSLQRAIGDFGLTSHLLSRTRKTDVMKNWPRRAAQDVAIVFSPGEREIYDAVWKIAGLLYDSASTWGRRMAALMAYRYTASCVPAAVELFRERIKLNENPFLASSIGDELDEDGDDLPPDLNLDDTREQAAIKELRRVLSRCPSPEHDSKLLKLRETLATIWAQDDEASAPRRKVILFSYFKRTLRYLREQLGKTIGLCMIHGGIPISEREEQITQFLEDPGIVLLLTSEVGGEGLDLQKASVVINYDLPWNPMVVEQRIGRVDRIGQEANQIVIVNFYAKGTVEERIIKRLYDRLEIFKMSVGEIEPILGEREVTELILADLKRDLPPDKLAEQVERTADAARRAIDDAERIGRESDGLLAADQAFLDEVEQLVTHRRIPTPQDLFELLRTFLVRHHPGHHLGGDPVNDIGSIALPMGARTAFSNFAQKYGAEAQRTIARLQLGPMDITFDADVAMRRSTVQLVQARHPLFQWMLHELGSQPHETRTFALTLDLENAPAGLGEGVWLVGIRSIEAQGTRHEHRLVAAATELDSGMVLTGDAAQPLLTALLDHAQSMDPVPHLPSAIMSHAATTLVDELDAMCDRLETETQEIDNRRLEVRQATWKTTLEQRVRAEEQRIRTMERDGRPQHVIRMRQGMLRKRREELDAKMAEFKETPRVLQEHTDIAAALVLVAKGG